MKVVFTWGDGTQSTLVHDSATKIEVEGLALASEIFVEGQQIWAPSGRPQAVFAVGDTVRVVEQEQEGPPVGMVGFVRRLGSNGSNPPIGVEWPSWVRPSGLGHNLDGHISTSNGWYMHPHQLARVEQVQSEAPPPLPPADFEVWTDSPTFTPTHTPYPTCETPCGDCRAALGACLDPGQVTREMSHERLDGRCLDNIMEVDGTFYHDDCAPA